MSPAAVNLDERKRLAALRSYDVLDSLPERALDELTALAATICEVPMAMISLVDEHRQWFKSRMGLEVAETPRDVSFCTHALEKAELLIVPDATQDARFATNPLVTCAPNVRFYAGAPLITPGGEAIGTLCVNDCVPRTLSSMQQEALRVLAAQVMMHLELRRHTRELMESEERLRIVTDSARVGLVIVDVNRCYAYANTAYAEILGLPSQTICGQRVAEVLADIYDAQVGPRLDRAFTGELVTYELQRPGPDGERHYAVCYSPRKSGDVVTQVVVVITEITETKRKEMASLRLAAIVAHSDDAIIGKDLNGIITSWNRGAEKIFGYAAEEMIGRSILRLIPVDRQDEEQHILGKIHRGESIEHFETLRLTKDGRSIHVSVTASPIRDATGRPIGVSKVARDVTERKRAEGQIAEQAAFLDKAQDAIIVRDLEGGILFWNKGAERIYGWAREEAVGQNIGVLIYANPARFDEVNRRTISQGEWHGELSHLTKQGGEITVEARWTLIRDPAGKPKSVLAINTDITEKKKIEAQFLRAQRMESIGTLAGGIAHDLNNVLSPIIVSLELLALKFPDSASRELLEILGASAHRGADMVRQVLSFARGVEGRRMEVQVKHLVKDLEKIVNDTFPKNIQTQSILPHDLWPVLGDPTQLHQVLLNLCVNARDAMPTGGQLTFFAENLTLDVQYAAMNFEATPGSYVLLQVEDSGTGMPPAILEKIFDPFFTTKEIGKGTGLGLSTSLAIVKSHGGFIRAYSEPGKGTKFRVYLPAQTESSAEIVAESAAELPRGNGELILVVDDEATVRLITQQTLQAFGYRVILACDGAEALAAYSRQGSEIAVVLTDMMMPVMDGAATILVLRKLNPAVRIVAASGLSSDGHAAARGLKHFLSKPYTARALLQTLKQIIE